MPRLGLPPLPVVLPISLDKMRTVTVDDVSKSVTVKGGIAAVRSQ